ncbi:MAG: cyclase family protein [Candidatus Thermoplasmatota archaeon]|nr:cyclase family protein [Candidatus Thermoplasmatota archaeon]
MKTIDLTHELYNKMPVYPGMPEFKITEYNKINNNGANALLLNFLTHHGTHIDAPYHIIESGKSIDDFSMNDINSTCVIIKFTDKKPDDKIELSDLVKYSDILYDYESVLFNTGWSDKREIDKTLYSNHWIGLSNDASEFLSKYKLKFIGTDGLSIASPPNNSNLDEIIDVHKRILDKDIFIVEELNLSNIVFSSDTTVSGKLTLVPLKIKNADGSPIRALFTYQ